jgi:hypothetical protein
MADNYDVTKDRYAAGMGQQASQPARRSLPVTPSDTKDVTNASGDNAPCYYKSLYIGVSGDVTVVCAGDNGNNLAGTGQLYKAHPVGYMPVQVRRVMFTGTTATNIEGLLDQ